MANLKLDANVLLNIGFVDIGRWLPKEMSSLTSWMARTSRQTRRFWTPRTRFTLS